MRELVRGFGILILYFVGFVAVYAALRALIKLPREVFRKMLHFMMIGSIFVWLYAFERWYIAIAGMGIFIVLIFPILWLCERKEVIGDALIERSKGELKWHMIIALIMMTVVTAICWGYYDDKMLSIAAILSWGCGDAAGALAGKKYGKTPLRGKMIEGKKSLEGTLAVFTVSLVAVAPVLIARGVALNNLDVFKSIALAALSAIACAAAELFTRRGMDTFTCPLATLAILVLYAR